MREFAYLRVCMRVTVCLCIAVCISACECVRVCDVARVGMCAYLHTYVCVWCVVYMRTNGCSYGRALVCVYVCARACVRCSGSSQLLRSSTTP